MAVQDQIIYPALKKIGVLAEGETPSATMETDAFNTLNGMIDSFSNEELFIFSILRETFTLNQGQQTYQMGSGAPDFNTVRPQRIMNAQIQLIGSNPVAEMPMGILNQAEYAAIIVKTITSTVPLYLYNDDAYPYANINFWPVPQATLTVVLNSWKPVSDFALMTSSVSFPPGYLECLIYNLAVRLGPDYGATLRDDVIALAVASKENIKRMNIKPQHLACDNALLSPRGAFNWITGDTI